MYELLFHLCFNRESSLLVEILLLKLVLGMEHRHQIIILSDLTILMPESSCKGCDTSGREGRGESHLPVSF